MRLNGGRIDVAYSDSPDQEIDCPVKFDPFLLCIFRWRCTPRSEFSLLKEIPARVSSIDKTLLLAVVKFDAFEWAIEKATELGVNRIVPLAAARSEKGLLVAAAKRAERGHGEARHARGRPLLRRSTGWEAGDRRSGHAPGS